MKTINLSNEEIDILLAAFVDHPLVKQMFWPSNGKWAIAYDLIQRLRHLRNVVE